MHASGPVPLTFPVRPSPARDSVTAEFGLVCHEAWRQSLIGSLYFVGVFLGVGVGGPLSDRYGRKVRSALTVTGLIIKPHHTHSFLHSLYSVSGLSVWPPSPSARSAACSGTTGPAAVGVA